jgi:hypothetical protein
LLGNRQLGLAGSTAQATNALNRISVGGNLASSADASQLGLLNAGIAGNTNASAADLARLTLGGSLAGQADSSTLGVNSLGIQGALGQTGARTSRLGLGLNAAQGADSSALGFLNAGTNAANIAQTQQSNRGQNAFNNTMSLGDRVSGLANQAYSTMSANDQNLMIQGIAAEVGVSAESLQQGLQKIQQATTDKNGQIMDQAAKDKATADYLKVALQGADAIGKWMKDNGYS